MKSFKPDPEGWRLVQARVGAEGRGERRGLEVAREPASGGIVLDEGGGLRVRWSRAQRSSA